MKKLLERQDRFSPRGVVRSDKSAGQLRGYGATDQQLFVGDILREGGEGVLKRAMQGADALVIATSAVPKINYLSLVPVMLAKLFKKEGVRPSFTFKEGQMPEQIDWEGQKAQIDAAKAAGVKHVVIVSSMGGTDPNNFLNTIGNGNILVWKRKAEEYLIAQAAGGDLKYTIVHPGGLIDEEGGKRELIIDVDDNLISSNSKYRRIPRADVAEFCVQSLLVEEALNRSVDLVSKEPGDGAPTTDFAALLRSMPKNCDYSLPKVAASATA
ncbi:NAD(P)-binding [Chlorella sorokiniana]|uniref:NAD(P)-binding n=1 Tax=Chlorella sorokiniana TaxID=3076 RepID=A0A2P6TJS6_CHLSO|nr:NAD(P)-binding [Chlorella sorokiniana]|eukprot:PRW44340.1 NAD(P)-binding [Chlorella sorokiniana]